MADSAVTVSVVTGGFGLAIAAVSSVFGWLGPRKRGDVPAPAPLDPQTAAAVIAALSKDLDEMTSRALRCEAREQARDDG